MSTSTATPDLDLEEDLEECTSFYKQYALIVHNDNDHSFEYVIICFGKVFKYTAEQCIELALRIHTEGRAIVYSGMLEHVELKADQIKGFGPDLMINKIVNYPLLTEIRQI